MHTAFGLRHRVVIVAIALAGATQARGQATPEELSGFQRRLEQIQRDTRSTVTRDVPADRRALVDYGGYLSASYFSVDSPAGTGLDNRGLWEYDLSAYARVNLDGAHEFYVRGRGRYRDYNAGDETSTDDDGLAGFVEEAYYRFDLARALQPHDGRAIDGDVVVTAGRQFVDWASGLVLSQYLDGVSVDLSGGGDRDPTLKLLAGVSAYDTTDFDVSRPAYDQDTTRGFYGLMASVRMGLHRPYVYALVQRDYNEDRPLPVGPASVRFGYDSYYLGAGSTGALSDRWRYAVEAVYEGGNGLSDLTADPANPVTVGQTRESINAAAAQMTLEYLPGDRWRSRANGGLVISTGDGDRGVTNSTLGGNLSRTADHAFNGFGLLGYGYAFAPPVSNLTALRLGYSAFPFAGTGPASRLQIGAELYLFAKTKTSGPIDEASRGDWFLGTEPDIYLSWRILEDVTIQARYGVFFPADGLQSDNVRQFLYTSVTYAF